MKTPLTRGQRNEAIDREVGRLLSSTGVLRVMIGTTSGQAIGVFSSNDPNDRRVEELRCLAKIHFEEQRRLLTHTFTRATVGDVALMALSSADGEVLVVVAFPAGTEVIKSARRLMRASVKRCEKILARGVRD